MSSYDEEYYCPNCGALLNDQSGFDPDGLTWTCTECGEELYDGELDNTTERFDGVVWYCDSCDAVLNKQSGFSDSNDTWECTECGHVNYINEDNIYESKEEYKRSRTEYECPHCYSTLNDQSSFYEDDEYTCDSCGTKLYKDGDEYREVEDYEEYECPNCYSKLNDQSSFCEDDEYTCDNCGTDLYKDCDEYRIDFRCPNCGSHLKNQRAFWDNYEWTCCECSAKLYLNVNEYIIRENDEESERNSTNKSFYNQDERSDSNSAKENQKQHPKRETPPKKPFNIKKFIRSLLILAILIGLGIISYLCYPHVMRFMSRTPIGYDSTELVGMDCRKVTQLLTNEGFENVQLVVINDLDVELIDNEYVVTKVQIDEDTSFGAEKKYYPDAEITITYHVLKEITLPLSSSDIIGNDYKDIEKKLKKAGFINIELVPKYDLFLGVLNKEGEIQSIEIGGSQEFEKYDEIRPDSKIVITYHAWKKDKPK